MQVVGRQKPVDEPRVEGRLVPGDGLPAELPANAVVALEGVKLTHYPTLALPRTLHRTDYEIGILGIGIAALVTVDVDVLGHCPPPFGSHRFSQKRSIAVGLDDMTRTEGVELISGSGPQGDLP